MVKETILNYPDFEEPFEIHIYVSDRYLYLVNSWDGKLLVFCSRKLSRVQKNYTTTGQELLSTV